jgi:hypothetical protein
MLMQRIFDFLWESRKISNQADFSRKLGYNSGYINKLLKTDSELPHKVQKRMNEVFGISKVFLESNGKDGTMFDDAESIAGPQIIPVGKHAPAPASAGSWPGLPMYNVPITASFVTQYRDDPEIRPYYYLDDPRFKDCDFGAIITGDSMHAEIRHGDFIACKRIEDWSFVVFGEIYYVVSTNGLETCKYLNADPNNPNNFLLVPRNESISPSPIPKDMILRMYKVRGIIRGY